MIYRKLGNTDLNVSTISLGCEGFMNKDTETVKRQFDFAIANGVNFIDIYASNPDLRANIGNALKGRRDGFYIQGHLCSVWENGQYLRSRNLDKTMAAFDEQLRLLQTDYLDVGMIHYVDDEKDFHRVFDGEVMQYALKLKAEGKIHYIGMSSHNPVVAQNAVRTGLLDVLLFAVNPCYDMLPPSEDVEELWADKNYEHPLQNVNSDRERLYELCESRGVGIDVMKTFGGGDILSETDSPFGKALTPVQCIEYALTRPGVAAVMLGCNTSDELMAALHWCDATADERDYASVMTAMDKFTWRGHCMYCGHCAPCKAGIDIASVNKFYNLSKTKGEMPETVREHYKSLSHHASECVACGRCEKNCPFGVEIIRGMKDAAERFGY
jgi:predicted aldo/keto reductase-like oxidoreductase